MSNYHSKEFLGFSTSAPPNVIPDWLFKILFFPPIKSTKGLPNQVPYGLRKIEARLIDKGFDVLTVDPNKLKRYIVDAKILCVHTMDPFGLGPSSTTFSRLLKTGESYLSKYFRLIFEKPEVQSAKKRGLKIFVGGPGTWQFKIKDMVQNQFGIDCVIVGEAEIVLPKLIHDALKGHKIPRYYEVQYNDLPVLEDISIIKKPSVNGLIEIGRGCPRGCSFCSVTLKPLRWYPPEKIKGEIKVNAKAGLTDLLFHAEDVLLYGSRTVIPERDKVLEIHRMAKKNMKQLGWSHASFAAIAADLKLIDMLSEIIIDKDQTWWGAEMGIETGSPQLVKRAMPAKCKPFKPEEWPEVVKRAAGVMNDNNLIPACTLITGLPQETEDDTLKTIELIDDLKDFKSLIVPLFFVPMGKLKNENWFQLEELSDLQKELMITCLRRDLKWGKEILNGYFKEKWYSTIISQFYKIFIWLIEKKGRELNIFDVKHLKRRDYFL
jgi:radical SAM superfamily enzyme YgiQ (UPF0313 family)